MSSNQTEQLFNEAIEQEAALVNTVHEPAEKIISKDKQYRQQLRAGTYQPVNRRAQDDDGEQHKQGSFADIGKVTAWGTFHGTYDWRQHQDYLKRSADALFGKFYHERGK